MGCKKNFIKIIGLLAICLGQVLFAPVGLAQPLPQATAAGQDTAGWHQVQPGDTYYRLSRLYQVPVDSLQHWNGPNLKLGTTVRVKPAANQPVVPAPDKPNPVVSPAFATKPGSTTPENNSLSLATSQTGNRVAVVPFDPALYFSDADNDIAWQSKIQKQKIRFVFQARLNALLQAPGYQIINLLQNPLSDSGSAAGSIYKNLAYSYQPIKTNNLPPVVARQQKGWKAWVKTAREKVGISSTPTEPAGIAHDQNKYYGAQIPDPTFLAALNSQTNANFYLLINQFEIFTDYSNCIDRTTQNFIRNFRVHYTILNANGEVLAGNKVLIPYESNVNDINVIVRDNLGKMASRIMADLPKPETINTSEARN